MKLKLIDIAKVVSEKHGLSLNKSRAIVGTIVEEIASSLCKGSEVYFRKIGLFHVTDRYWKIVDKKKKWNPFDNKTNDGVSRVASVKFSKQLKDRLKGKQDESKKAV